MFIEGQTKALSCVAELLDSVNAERCIYEKMFLLVFSVLTQTLTNLATIRFTKIAAPTE